MFRLGKIFCRAAIEATANADAKINIESVEAVTRGSKFRQNLLPGPLADTCGIGRYPGDLFALN